MSSGFLYPAEKAAFLHKNLAKMQIEKNLKKIKKTVDK